MKSKVIKMRKPKQGDTIIKNGLKYIFDGRYWSLDEIIYNTIDRHHTYRRNNLR